MRVVCKCQKNINVTQSEFVSETIRQFYGTCNHCGRRWKGTVSLDYLIQGPHADLSLDLVNALSQISVEQQQQILDALTTKLITQKAA